MNDPPTALVGFGTAAQCPGQAENERTTNCVGAIAPEYSWVIDFFSSLLDLSVLASKRPLTKLISHIKVLVDTRRGG
jgi:hypothetical protein